jgi:hypothetical protein
VTTTYRPEQWSDFFLTVGTGAATLTGLVVVAMSMHLEIIASDPVLRHRARMVLAGLAGAFLRCSLALMGGQDGRAVAVDLIVVCLVINVLGLASYAPISRLRTRHRDSFVRTLLLFVCYTAEMVGAGFLFFDAPWGLNLAAAAMIANLTLMISGAWLLLLGVRQDESSAT